MFVLRLANLVHLSISHFVLDPGLPSPCRDYISLFLPPRFVRIRFCFRQSLITHHRSLTYLYPLSHSTCLALIVAALSSSHSVLCEYDFSDSNAHTSHVKFWSLEAQSLRLALPSK